MTEPNKAAAEQLQIASDALKAAALADPNDYDLVVLRDVLRIKAMTKASPDICIDVTRAHAIWNFYALVEQQRELRDQETGK